MLGDSLQIQTQARMALLQAEARREQLARLLPATTRPSGGLRSALAAGCYALALRLDPRLAPRTT